MKKLKKENETHKKGVIPIKKEPLVENNKELNSLIDENNKLKKKMRKS